MQKGGARVKQKTACSGSGGWIDRITHLAVRVVAVVVKQRRRGEHCVVVLQQEAVVVFVILVVVPAVRQGPAGGAGLVIRRGAGAGDNGVGRRDRVPGTEALRGAVDFDHSGGRVARVGATHGDEVVGAVLGGVGVAAGELLHEGTEARGAGLDAHGVGDVHHLDRLLAPALAAAAALLPPRRRAAADAAPAAGTGSIAPGTAMRLPPLVVIHLSGAL